MTYLAPVSETDFLLRHCTSLPDLIGIGACPDISPDLVHAILEQAGRFAADVLGPLNSIADRQGVLFRDGEVKTAAGHRKIYQAWAAAGWNSVSASPEWGGMGMPQMINVACLEYWHSACMAFGLGPLLSMGAAETIEAYGSRHLKEAYLPKLVAGEWMATMNLTEPHAGSDLGTLSTRASPQADGSYRIVGSKIFITYGEHDLTKNILHLVLARLPDAAPGSKGISLFLVPKYLMAPDGSLGEANDVCCTGIEHKLGLHGSPTCSMSFGADGGAVGWLIGEEGRGLAAMFTMMNRARLAVAVQGVAIAEAATQKATSFARERRQGRAPGANGGTPSAIIDHPDVVRMLLTMRAMTNAARCICVKTADALDRARLSPDVRARNAAQLEADLLTPVAKAFATDTGVEVASLGIQVHGGTGFIEDSGAPQYLRDVRICTIYEGTNGIQAIDLVMRKLVRGPERVAAGFFQQFKDIARNVQAVDHPSFGNTAKQLLSGIESLTVATHFIEACIAEGNAAPLAGATTYLRLFALTAGMAYLAEAALMTLKLGRAPEQYKADERIAIARFFAEHIGSACSGLSSIVVLGSDAVMLGRNDVFG